ncbi:uncharacterized protein TNCV_4403421 [Trichonephila clavipes]|uniref:Tc1-like transposase DDE domain-containing protein n=1 Tax=Trichonephila clavipes TaxID=2585209 RepID=A0A8X6VGZ0_TRICX|nr:uncharacterized protein TNCV_4403421 [Trichonephila clavipes]
MDDNATCHRTLAVQDCLDSEGIQRLVWPARSPDLNPIKNVWDALGRQVAGRNYPSTNKNTLIRALTEEWDKLPQQLLDNFVQNETEFKIEFNIIEEYREKVFRIELKSKGVLENIKSKQNNNEGSNSGNNSHLADCENPYKAITPRLPEDELYKFGGELKDWLTFWNQFKNIHENKNLTNCDKFHYLVQSTKIKSEARELIESFPITNENYPLAIESLVERYGRNELLIDFYVRELLKLVLNNATKKKQDSLSGLYNKLSTQLRALSSLGITTDQCGIILYPLVESALPTHILRSFD